MQILKKIQKGKYHGMNCLGGWWLDGWTILMWKNITNNEYDDMWNMMIYMQKKVFREGCFNKGSKERQYINLFNIDQQFGLSGRVPKFPEGFSSNESFSIQMLSYPSWWLPKDIKSSIMALQSTWTFWHLYSNSFIMIGLRRVPWYIRRSMKSYLHLPVLGVST